MYLRVESPNDYKHESEEMMARFWWRVERLDFSRSEMEIVIADKVDALYRGACLDIFKENEVFGDETNRRLFGERLTVFALKLAGIENAPHIARKRIRSLLGEIDAPDDFNEIGAEVIERLFYGSN